jgi:uncharacterized protein
MTSEETRKYLETLTGITDEAFIKTRSGRRFWGVTGPRAVDVNVRDIANALGQKTRFTGHLREQYSVAQHSVFVAKILQHEFNNAKLTYAGLHHDGSEAYLPDVPTPYKRNARWAQLFREDEASVTAAINQALGISTSSHDRALIKFADTVAISAEIRWLMQDEDNIDDVNVWKTRVEFYEKHHGMIVEAGIDVPLNAWPWASAAAAYLAMHDCLKVQLGSMN